MFRTKNCPKTGNNNQFIHTTGRSVIDSYAKQSHELAIACEALLLQLRKGDRLSENDEITRLSISSELDNVLSVRL